MTLDDVEMASRIILTYSKMCFLSACPKEDNIDVDLDEKSAFQTPKCCYSHKTAHLGIPLSECLFSGRGLPSPSEFFCHIKKTLITAATE